MTNVSNLSSYSLKIYIIYIRDGGSHVFDDDILPSVNKWRQSSAVRGAVIVCFKERYIYVEFLVPVAVRPVYVISRRHPSQTRSGDVRNK